MSNLLDDRIHHDGEVALIAMPRRLALADVEPLQPELRAFIAQGHARVILDLRSTEFMDSSGIAMLVSALKATGELGGKLVLLGPNEQLLALLKLTRLDKVFPIEQERALALSKVRA